VEFLNDVKQKAAEFVKDNATVLLTAGGVVGTVATAVLTGRAGYKAAEIIREKELEHIHPDGVTDAIDPDNATMGLSPQQKFMLVWPHFAIPVLTGATTVTAIILSHRMSAQKAAALAAAYGLAERNLSEYKEKVAEKLTGPKKEAIKEELAQDQVNRTPGSDKIVFVEGEVLCFDRPTGRYFNSTMESIKRAVNATNAEVFNHGFASANFFYTELGLDETNWAGEVGFMPDNLLELDYDTILAPGNRPCIALDFKQMPRTDFHPKYD